jgi:hypothetical protein
LQVHLRAQKGYQVGMFGKSNFNTYEGFDRWFQAAVCGYGGHYEDNESPTFHTAGGPTDYATDFIAEKALEWLKRDNVSGASNGGRPFFIYFAPHCPHTPAIPSIKYNESCVNVTSPRLPNYNFTGPGFHQLVASQVIRYLAVKRMPRALGYVVDIIQSCSPPLRPTTILFPSAIHHAHRLRPPHGMLSPNRQDPRLTHVPPCVFPGWSM